jgi:hypothetical protein
MALILEAQVFYRHVACAQGCDDLLCLPDRHARIEIPDSRAGYTTTNGRWWGLATSGSNATS